MPSPFPNNKPVPQGKLRAACFASPRPRAVQNSEVLHFTSHSKLINSTGAFPYPHSPLRAELFPWFFRFSSRPIWVSVKVKTLCSKRAGSFPLFKVLAGLFPDVIRRESYCLQLVRKQIELPLHSCLSLPLSVMQSTAVSPLP